MGCRKQASFAGPDFAAVCGISTTPSDRDVGGPYACRENQGTETAQADEHHEHPRKGSEAMIAMQVAEIIAEYAVFLELTGDEELNPDTAVKMMEALASHLQEMDKGFLRELVNAFTIIAEEYSGEAQEVVRNISYGYYLEEALAADDPVKLATLEALRDATG